MTVRVELKSREFPGESSGPHLLITGGVHGDEFEPVAAIRRLIENFDVSNRLSKLRRGRLTLVPVVNEAAFLRGTRTADDELDLARVCPGQPDGSVTQQTAHALSELIRAADFYIDLHSGGTVFSVLPMTGYSLHPDEQIRNRQREMTKAFNLPVVWGTSPDLDGRSLSVARDAGVPAIYAEYHGSGMCDPCGVEAYIAGCFNVMSLLDMIDRSPVEKSLVEQIVEDPRPSSGHMQVCNPSPMTGIFEPAVSLGDRISVGDCIGAVHDSLGRKPSKQIPSLQSGLVLVLRTFSRVMEGESVGVILETSTTPAETT